MKTLTGHDKPIYSLKLLNEIILASCSNDKAIKLWDITSGQKLRTLRGHTDLVHCLILLDDEIKLASCSADSTIKLWNITNVCELKTLTGHTGGV